MSWFRSRVSRPGDLYCRALRIPWRFLSCEFRSFFGGNVLECRGIDIAKCVVTMIGMAARRKSDGVTSLSERASGADGSSCGAESANPGWRDMIGFWRILMNNQATPAHTLGRNGPGSCPGRRYAKIPGPKTTSRRGSPSAVLIAPERPMTTDLISVPSFVPEYLGSFGIDMREVLRQAGLSPMLFHGGKTRITTRDFFALWNAIEKVGAPADFGFAGGKAGPPPPPARA